MSWEETDETRELISAVLLALERVDLSRRQKLLVLSGALEFLTVEERVDEAALIQLVGDN